MTYAEEISKTEDGRVITHYLIDGGAETVETPLPVIVTVSGSAAPCRPRHVKLVVKYEYATCPMERKGDEPWTKLYEQHPCLASNQWPVVDVDGDPAQCGLSGLLTKVKSMQNIVFQAREGKTLTSSDEHVRALMKELTEEKIIGQVKGASPLTPPQKGGE